MVGLNARNIQDISQQYHCRICSLILRDPVQLGCGHRQCKSCVEAEIEREVIVCPECQVETHQNEVLSDRGAKNDMKSLVILCSICKWNGVLKDYEDHLVNSHPNPSCKYCGKTFNSTNQLDLHELNECDNITVPCALKDYGCSDSVLRLEMSDHYRTEQHQRAIIGFIRGELHKFVNGQSEGGSGGMDIDTHPHTTTSSSANTNAQIEEISETINVLADGTQTLHEDAQRLSTESLQLHNKMDVLAKDFAALKLSVQEQNGFLDGLTPNQEILQQDVTSIKQKLEDLQFVSYDGTLIWKIVDFAAKMGKSFIDRIHSHNKYFYFLADAQSERQTSIYSPPFYSSPTGYKMRVRLYLHGDGNARGTHMSLFFVLMRSEYDAILKFPFNYKVTFCLYDQTSAQKHITDSFRPDVKSNSFQRPRSEMNIASGIPKFFPLAEIRQENTPYIRDNTMFLKIMVDFVDMPKTILQYAFGLNPALPANIQQNMIKQEGEKRAQQTPSSSTT